MLTEMQKNKKGPLSQKNKMFDYIQLLMIGKQSQQKTLTKTQKNEKAP